MPFMESFKNEGIHEGVDRNVSQQGIDPLALVLGLPAGLEDEVPQPMYGQQPDELP